MALFRHALQVCTIVCITISIHGHVLLAVNVEDFRNLANQFLSKNLASQLSQLVSTGANRRDNTQAGNHYPEIDLNKVAELIRDRLLQKYTAPVALTKKVTRKLNIKRFSTVQNTVDMDERPKFTNKFSNPNYETTSPGLVYVKDDLEKLLQMNTDDTDSDRKQVDYAGTRQEESEEKTLPQNFKGLFDDMREGHDEKQRDVPIKMDYTETKLGEWLFNHILSQKPTKIQNHKISNSDINDEGSTEETPDKSENERRVQYVYETHLSGRNDKIKQNVQYVPALGPKNKDSNDVKIKDQLTGEHGTIDEYVMRPKLKPQKQLEHESYTGSQTKHQEIDKKIVMDKHKYGKPIQNTFNHGNVALDQDEGRMPASLEEIKPESIKAKIESSLDDAVDGKPPPLEEHITYDKYILGSNGKDNHLKEPHKQPVGENYMYENDELAQQTNSSNNNRVDLQKVYDSEEKLIQENKKIFNNEKLASNKHEADQSLHDQLLLRHKKGHLVIKSSKNHHYLSDKEVKSGSVKSKIDDTVEGKDQQEVSHIKFTEEKYTHRKPQNKPVEENDVYEKYALGADTKGNNHGKVKPRPDDDYIFKHTVPGMKFEFDDDNTKDDEFYTKDKSVLENTESDSSVKVAKHGVFTTKVPKKKEKVDNDLLPDFQAAKLGSSSSYEIKDKNAEKHDKFNKYDFEKYYDPYKPKKQPIEENDMYKTYSLGSKDKDSTDREVKNDDDKYGYQETGFGKKNKRDHPNRDKDKENDMNENYSLGSAEKNSHREEKRDYNKYGYKQPDFGKNNKETVLGKKDKRDHHSFDKDYEINDDKYGYKNTVSGKKDKGGHPGFDKDEENDMYDKYSLGTKAKNSRDREDDEIDDGKYGHKETVSDKKNNRDHRVRNKNEENGMYSKYSLGSKGKNSNDRNVGNNDKYGYKKPVSGKKNDENDDEENGMYDKHTLGSKIKKSRDREFKKDDKYGYKETVLAKKNKEVQRQLDKVEENNMYVKYSLGSKDKSSTEAKKRDNNNYGFKDIKKNINRGRVKDSANNDKLLLKNTQINKVKKLKHPSEGYAGDPRPDFKEVQAESMKAKTGSLLDSVEEKGKPTKHFTMKGTLIPKREFYKLSSPNYYKDLPRIVDKYDFDEPLPERDRQRDEAKYLKREPSRVNRKLKLPRFEKVNM